MRRIAIALLLRRARRGHLMAARRTRRRHRSPAAGGGPVERSLQIQLFTSDANPKAGTCTLIQAIVTLNGNPVPDGTGVAFSTDFGTFGQNGLPLVSVVTTQGGAAVTALCAPERRAPPRSRRHGDGRRQDRTRRTLPISFQPSAQAAAVRLLLQPELRRRTTGGTTVTLNGGRFFGTRRDDARHVHGRRRHPRRPRHRR